MKGGKLTDQYFDYVLEYEKKYGKNTAVLMQKGDFMELYGLENEEETIGHLSKLCKLLEIECTFTSSVDLVKKPGNTRENPLMAGVNIRAYHKYVNKLLNANYTIVEVTEVSTNSDGSKKREVTDIISKGCHINSESDTSNIVCLYGEVSKHHKTQQNRLMLGLCCIDITTGKSTIYEAFDKNNDNNFAINEAYRFIQVSRPKQVLICDTIPDIQSMVSQLELNKDDYTIVSQNKHNEKIDYQKAFYQKLFPCNGNVLEHLNLSRNTFASTSYVYLLNYVYERNKTFVNNLKVPTFWKESSHMLLHHNTTLQLDLYSKDKDKITLCKLLNKCRTKPGKRLFVDRLLNPLTKEKHITKRYDSIETILNLDTEEVKYFLTMLDGVYDLERLFRKMALEMLQPSGLYYIYISLNKIINIIEKLEQFDIKIFSYSSFYSEMKEFKKYIEDTFITDKLKLYSNLNKDIEFQIFQEGICPKIDEIVNSQDYMKELETFIETMDSSYKKAKCNQEKNCFLLKKDKKEYIIEVTKARYRQYLNTTTLTDPKYLEFEDSGKAKHRLTNKYIKDLSKKIRLSSDSLNDLIVIYYKLHIEEINKRFKDVYYPISKFISEFDVIVNNALLSKEFKYTKPNLDLTVDHSYMEIKGIRHPIVEQIRKEEKYVANDITIGKDETGIILFGPNAGGKSTTLKALGIVAIMAQAGMYVPCSYLKIGIYNNLSSRILGNDDLSKGQSSFEVEMTELNHILRRSDHRSLVLGDEICRGTTTTDAVSLVSSSIVELSNRKTNFMYTTHLHKLTDIQCIKNLNNVGIYHIHVIIENNKVIYDRTIKPGNGSTMYGIEIARAMNMDEEFIRRAHSVRDDILDQEQFILSQRPSKYNRKIYMEKCEICGEKGEDTHHIEFQCMAGEDGMINHYHMNSEHNLVTLCKKCHTKVHQYKYRIDGWRMTSEGKELKYEKIKREKREECKKEIEKKINVNQEKKLKSIQQKQNKDLRKKMLKLLEDQKNGSFTSVDDYL